MINGALTCVLVFLALMIGGTVGGWAVWPTAERHGYRRGYTEGHRRADREERPALPRAGRLPVEPPWRFAGESEQGWAAESAEYELLTQTAELPEVVPGVDSPSDFEQSMTERVNEMIAAWAEQGNYDRHTMHEVG